MRNLGLQPQFDRNSDLTSKQWGLTSKWSCSSANVLFSDMWISANISSERLVIKRNHNHLVALLRKSSTRYLWHGKPTIILTPICRWHMFFLLTKKTPYILWYMLATMVYASVKNLVAWPHDIRQSVCSWSMRNLQFASSAIFDSDNAADSCFKHGQTAQKKTKTC